MMQLEKMRQYWSELYSDDTRLNEFIEELRLFKEQHALAQLEPEWYKDSVVYCLYVDQFNRNLNGLTDKLDYLQDLGITCLWLLPILDSPLKDYGFDIRHYQKVRKDLLGLSEEVTETAWVETQQRVFASFIKEAHHRNIRVIFDIAMNHTSNQHEWFQTELERLRQLQQLPNPANDYYLWSQTAQEYQQAGVIFNDEGDSAWHRDKEEDAYYYFHRFYKEQPDLNYRNPNVLLAMCRNLLYWVAQGVDGFRVDAIPFLWKEEGTNCESLPQVHLLIKFFRAALDFVRPNTLLLAEAVLPSEQVVKYLGQGDECQAAYHFPLMSNTYLALTKADNAPIVTTLESTLSIPESCQWFILLRCHDSLALEMVKPEERKILFDAYCHDPNWGFMQGDSISARLVDLFKGNAAQIHLINSILLTLIGTPIIYYGDEFAMPNDVAFWKSQVQETGHNDSRFLVRGKVNWAAVEQSLRDAHSLSAQVFYTLKKQLEIRQLYHHYFGQGQVSFIPVTTGDGQPNSQVLAYQRFLPAQKERMMVFNNLSAQPQEVTLQECQLCCWTDRDLLGQPLLFSSENCLHLPAYGYRWVL